MKRSIRAVWWFLLANLVGFIIAIVLASLGWAPRGEEELPPGAGDAIITTFYLVPVMAVMLVFNSAWLIGLLIAVARKSGRALRVDLVVFCLVIAVWGIAIAYDHSRQYTGTAANVKAAGAALERARVNLPSSSIFKATV
jgi:hypothetical protein